MNSIILVILISLTFSDISYAGCANPTSPIDEIIACPQMPYVNTWPECDRSIPVNKIEGDLYYWDEFFMPQSLPCQSETFMLPATIDVGTNLQQCLPVACDEQSNNGNGCKREILVQPYFASNQKIAKTIARQEQCTRRHYVAKGCFVKGSKGRIFVANYIDFLFVKPNQNN